MLDLALEDLNLEHLSANDLDLVDPTLVITDNVRAVFVKGTPRLMFTEPFDEDAVLNKLRYSEVPNAQLRLNQGPRKPGVYLRILRDVECLEEITIGPPRLWE